MQRTSVGMVLTKVTALLRPKRELASRTWPLTPPHLYLWTAGTASAAAALTVAAEHRIHISSSLLMTSVLIGAHFDALAAGPTRGSTFAQGATRGYWVTSQPATDPW